MDVSGTARTGRARKDGRTAATAERPLQHAPQAVKAWAFVNDAPLPLYALFAQCLTASHESGNCFGLKRLGHATLINVNRQYQRTATSNHNGFLLLMDGSARKLSPYWHAVSANTVRSVEASSAKHA